MTGINISAKMDELQAFMEAQRHFRNDGKCRRMIDELRMNIRQLSESDKEYVYAAEHALIYGDTWDRER